MNFKDVVQSVKSGTKEAVEVTKLKTQISKDKGDIRDNYGKIGEYIYKNCRERMEDIPELAKLMVEIDNSFVHIDACKEEISRAKISD
ncbi:MAG: hypothetical protein ACI4D8_05980 [Wujia sp.]